MAVAASNFVSTDASANSKRIPPPNLAHTLTSRRPPVNVNGMVTQNPSVSASRDVNPSCLHEARQTNPRSVVSGYPPGNSYALCEVGLGEIGSAHSPGFREISSQPA